MESGFRLPPLFKELGGRRLVRSVEQGRLLSVTDMTAEVNAGAGTNVSEHTVKRTFVENRAPQQTTSTCSDVTPTTSITIAVGTGSQRLERESVEACPLVR